MSARDPAARQRLDDVLRPAVARVDHARRTDRTHRAFGAAVRAFPPFAALVAVAAIAIGLHVALPWWLPAAVAAGLAVLAYVVAHRAAPYRAPTLVDGALACDRAHDNHDRLAAACELAGAAPLPAADLPEALARAAIEDGLASLDRVDAAHLRVPAAGRRPAWQLAAACLAGLLLLPFLLPHLAEATAEPTGPGPATGRASPGTGEGRTQVASHPATQEAPPGGRGDAANERRDQRPKPGSPPPPPKAEPAPAVPAASGQGQSGSDAAGESAQTGAPKAAPAGKAGSGQSGGGAGSAASGAPEPQPDEKTAKAAPKPTPKKPQRETPQQEGKPSESAGAPSGPSRGSGRMAAVGNKRNDQNRGLEREDDPQVEDDPVEDESDEQEQRGGVMPMRRGDNRPAARELSISGDGPPDQGRGGPTPPKKARGTASLVLGLRLPDSVRGQPNPGTAKTSLEQIPPRPATADPGLARAAGQGRAATPQSPRHPDSLTSLLLAYHQWLAQQDAPSAPPTPPVLPR